jgi:hypothetical protein
MNMSKGVIKLGVAGFLALLSVSALNSSVFGGDAKQPEKYNLVYKMDKGLKRSVTYETAVSGEVKVMTFGRHPLMKFAGKLARAFTEQVMSVKGSLPPPAGRAGDGLEELKLKRDYTASSITRLEPVEPDGAMNPGPEEKKENTIKDNIDLRTFDIAYEKGKGLTMKSAFKKKSGNPAGEAEEMDEMDARRTTIPMHEADFGLFMPQAKMAIGEGWEVNWVVISKVISLHDGRPVRYVHQTPEVGMRFNILEGSSVKCTLEEVAAVDNIQCAKIKVSGKLITKEDDILNNEITLSGFIYFDLKKGAIHKVELDGDMKLEGEYPGRSTDKGMALRCKVEGAGKLSLRVK